MFGGACHRNLYLLMDEILPGSYGGIPGGLEAGQKFGAGGAGDDSGREKVIQEERSEVRDVKK